MKRKGNKRSKLRKWRDPHLGEDVFDITSFLASNPTEEEMDAMFEKLAKVASQRGKPTYVGIDHDALAGKPPAMDQTAQFVSLERGERIMSEPCIVCGRQGGNSLIIVKEGAIPGVKKRRESDIGCLVPICECCHRLHCKD